MNYSFTFSPKNDRIAKNIAIIKNTIPMYGAIFLNPSLIAISIASKPNKVVNFIIGFKETEAVSLKGSPTVSPITVAS